METELNLDPDSKPDPNPELITDPDPNLQIISDPAGSGCTNTGLRDRQCGGYETICPRSGFSESSRSV